MRLSGRLKRELLTCVLQALPMPLLFTGLLTIWLGSW